MRGGDGFSDRYNKCIHIVSGKKCSHIEGHLDRAAWRSHGDSWAARMNRQDRGEPSAIAGSRAEHDERCANLMSEEVVSKQDAVGGFGIVTCRVVAGIRRLSYDIHRGWRSQQ